jgi:hypothetical protein
MNYKGPYTSEMLYLANDIVSFVGNVFICRKGVRGEQPSPSDPHWTLIVPAGVDGKMGPPGKDGKDGDCGHGVPQNGQPGQFLSKLGTVPGECNWQYVSCQSIGSAEKIHTHSVGDVSGLQDALNCKSNYSHTHNIHNLDGFVEFEQLKANVNHFHTAGSILGGKLVVDTVDTASVTADEIIVADRIKFSEDKLAISLAGIDRIACSMDQIFLTGEVFASRLNVSGGSVPLTSTGTGRRGAIVISPDYLYICVSENKWKRIALQEW